MKKTIIKVNQDRNPVFPDRLKHSGASHILNRIYIEITNHCNLECRICIRNTWNDGLGTMLLETYQKLIKDIECATPVPEIFFGGYGEPLSHPDIIEMIRSAAQIGAETSLITNGTLLGDGISKALVTSGLNRLWVSLDGAHADSYQDIQLGAYLPQIIHNLERFQEIKSNSHAIPGSTGGLELGIAFVLMKRNIADFLDIIDLGRRLGINSFFITNVEAYSEDMAKEVLYQDSLRSNSGNGIDLPQEIWMPGLQDNPALLEEMMQFLEMGSEVKLEGSPLNRDPALCPFATRGAAAVRWDGEVSPCLPLFYDHTTFVGSWKRQIYKYTLGNIGSRSIQEIWLDPNYMDFRDRLLDKDFSPCVNCQDCWLSEDNRLDCMGFEHPTCGGCLWAHGVIQCP